MALAYNTRRATADLDAIFEPKASIYEAAQVVALEKGLPPAWLNDSVKGFLLGDYPQARVILNFPALVVAVASPRYLFVLKALASRPERDFDDLITLYALSEFNSAEEAIAYISYTLGNRPIAAKVKFTLLELFGSQKDLSKVANKQVSTPCGAWMPKAKTYCVLPKGHRPENKHRSSR